MKLLCAGLIMVSSAALASDPAVNPSTPALASKAEAPKLICEKRTDIGTRLAARKVCGTKEQWDQRQADEQLRARRAQAGGNPGGQ